MKKKLTTRDIKKFKGQNNLNMLTAYDFQTAQMLDQTELDLILVGDSLGNVILGYDTTVEVTLNDMITFAKAVKRGAPNTFTVADLPFGSYATMDSAISNAVTLFRESKVEALKLEGGSSFKCQIVQRLTDNGMAIMGHLGLTPQSVHEQGGYYTHGKNHHSYQEILTQAQNLQNAGCFALVLECVTHELAQEITQTLNIPTIGIGSGDQVDGQVLVINDLLKSGPNMPPSFCTPITDLYQYKKELIEQYLTRSSPSSQNDSVISNQH